MLCAVEAMHFIDEQDRAQSMAFQPLSGVAHFDTEVFHTRENGIERTEMRSGVIGNDAGQGRFADAGWAMKDQIANTIRGDGTA